MELRTHRGGLLVDQLTHSAEISRSRLRGLTDDEHLWEPTAEMWSVRPRGEAVTGGAYGPGEWVMDFEPLDPFAPGPVTTIAWRIAHVTSMLAGRYEWTFGEHRTAPEEVAEFSPRAGLATHRLWGWVDRWAAAVDDTTDEQLEEVGFSRYPWGLDPDIPFAAVCWWVNREFIHHMAEVALLRDLYAHRTEA